MEVRSSSSGNSNSGGVLLKCATCGTTEQLLRCAKCKTIFYCCISHQHLDWPRHKQECRALAKQKCNNKLQQQQQLQQIVATTILTNNHEFINVEQQQQQQEEEEKQLQQFVAHTKEIELNLSENDYQFPHAHAHHNNELNMQEHNNAALLQQMHIGNDGSQHVATTIITPKYDDLNIDFMSGASNMLPQIQQQEQQQQQYQVVEHNEFTTQLSTHANNQLEKSSSYQIGQVDDTLLGNVNERRYEDLCRNIINDMNEYGLSVVDDFLGMEKGLQILNEVHCMYSAGVFQDGQLVNNARPDQNLKTIRGDKTTWVKGVEPSCSNVGYLINQIDNVICRANTMKNNGKLGQYKIKERTKAMVACYPGSGTQYVMHVDNPNKDGRVITAIYYLNLNWNTKQSGGLLRIFPEHGNTVADIEPIFDRLIFFWSDKRNPHEVQPAHRTRYAITVWYFDANEREAALNHCKYVNNKTTTTTTGTETSKTNATAAGATTTTTNNSTVMDSLSNGNKAATSDVAQNGSLLEGQLDTITATTTTNNLTTNNKICT